jgi:large subunit ribosomal protein L30
MAKVRIKQVKSTIGSSERQKRTMQALGITKLNGAIEHEATPQIIGMINKVKHLVVVENL